MQKRGETLGIEVSDGRFNVERMGLGLERLRNAAHA